MSQHQSEPLLPAVPPGLRKRRVGLAAIVTFFGPGAIVASLTVGSGETVLASRMGAIFGFAMMWLIVIGAVSKGLIVYASNRYITVTGEHPMRGLRRVLPGPRGWFPALIGALAILSFPFVASALATGLGDYLELIVGGPAAVWGLSLLALAGALSWFGWYTLLEKAQVAIVGLQVTLVLVAAVVSMPDWAAVLGGLVPQGLSYADFVPTEYPGIAERSIWVEAVVFMGGLGGGMYDYIGYTGLLREKRWGALGRAERLTDPPTAAPLELSDTPSERRRVRAWSRAPLGDVLLSFGTMAVLTMAFVITGKEILGAAQQVPNDNNVLTYQGSVLEVIHPIFGYFYVIAIIMVFFGTMYALWEVYARTTYESLSAVSERVHRGGMSRIRGPLYLFVLLGGAALVITGADLVALITPANIIGGTVACGIYGVGLLVLERRVLPDRMRINRWVRALIAVSSAVLVVAGVVALGQLIGVLQ